ANVAGILDAIEHDERLAGVASRTHRLGRSAFVHTGDRHDALRRHGLRRGPIRRGRECDARLRMERELVALADRDELEVESGSFGLLQHARAFQEGEAWLTPEGEASKPADDLVVRAAD